jgi:hypothetical protein
MKRIYQQKSYVISPSSYRSYKNFSIEIPYAFLVAYIQNILPIASQLLTSLSQQYYNLEDTSGFTTQTKYKINIVREGYLSNYTEEQHNGYEV